MLLFDYDAKMRRLYTLENQTFLKNLRHKNTFKTNLTYF